MTKQFNIIILLLCFGIYLSACGGKQYEIELLSSAADASASAPTADLAESIAGTDPDTQTTRNQTATDLPEDLAREVLLNESNFRFVHICGAVMNPGVYEVAKESRVFEVLEMAGGFTDDAATDAVNLAMNVADGCKIRIPTVAEAAEAVSANEQWLGYESGDTDPVNDLPAGSLTDLVNINSATLEILLTLPGIGKAKAESIITYREETGGFKAIEDIMNITGIKDGVFSKIKDRICV